MKDVVIKDGDKIRLGCPFCNSFYTIGEKTDPPFRWTESDAIKAVVSHIERNHTILEIKTFFEDYLADKYFTSPSRIKEAKK